MDMQYKTFPPRQKHEQEYISTCLGKKIARRKTGAMSYVTISTQKMEQQIMILFNLYKTPKYPEMKFTNIIYYI